jgi:hypothetical protein
MGAGELQPSRNPNATLAENIAAARATPEAAGQIRDFQSRMPGGLKPVPGDQANIDNAAAGFRKAEGLRPDQFNTDPNFNPNLVTNPRTLGAPTSTDLDDPAFADRISPRQAAFLRGRDARLREQAVHRDKIKGLQNLGAELPGLFPDLASGGRPAGGRPLGAPRGRPHPNAIDMDFPGTMRGDARRRPKAEKDFLESMQIRIDSLNKLLTDADTREFRKNPAKLRLKAKSLGVNVEGVPDENLVDAISNELSLENPRASGLPVPPSGGGINLQGLTPPPGILPPVRRDLSGVRPFEARAAEEATRAQPQTEESAIAPQAIIPSIPSVVASESPSTFDLFRGRGFEGHTLPPLPRPEGASPPVSIPSREPGLQRGELSVDAVSAIPPARNRGSATTSFSSGGRANFSQGDRMIRERTTGKMVILKRDGTIVDVNPESFKKSGPTR